MLSYQNRPELKTMFQERFAAHRAADEVIQSVGFENGRGCFIGCTMNEYNHESFGNQIGPEWLAHLADKIFEGLDQADAPRFGTDLLAAIPVGVDLEPVKWKIAIQRHERQLTELADNEESYAEKCRTAIQGVIDYCKLKLLGGSSESARSAAWSAAWSAAESAAWSAAESAAWSAAWSAADSAESAASSAAWSADSAESAAWSAEFAAWSAADSASSAAWSAAESAAWSARQTSWEIERDCLLAAIREMGGEHE